MFQNVLLNGKEQIKLKVVRVFPHFMHTLAVFGGSGLLRIVSFQISERFNLIALLYAEVQKSKASFVENVRVVRRVVQFMDRRTLLP